MYFEWSLYRGSPDSTNFGFQGFRVIKKSTFFTELHLKYSYKTNIHALEYHCIFIWPNEGILKEHFFFHFGYKKLVTYFPNEIYENRSLWFWPKVGIRGQLLWWCSDCRNRVSKIAYLFCNMTNECFAILVSAPDFIELGPLLHCTHCTKKLKKVSYVAYPRKMRYWRVSCIHEKRNCMRFHFSVFFAIFYFPGFLFSNRKMFKFCDGITTFCVVACIFSLIVVRPVASRGAAMALVVSPICPKIFWNILKTEIQ